jgi:hypothetical protein
VRIASARTRESGPGLRRQEDLTMTKSAMTYGELKAELDKFTPEQLLAPVFWVGVERGAPVHEVWVIDEEHVDLGSGDGLEPVSSYADDPEGLPEGEVVARWPAGTPFLCTDEG